MHIKYNNDDIYFENITNNSVPLKIDKHKDNKHYKNITDNSQIREVFNYRYIMNQPTGDDDVY